MRLTYARPFSGDPSRTLHLVTEAFQTRLRRDRTPIIDCHLERSVVQLFDAVGRPDRGTRSARFTARQPVAANPSV